MSNTKENIYVAVDIEKAGDDSSKYKVVSIGAVLGDVKGKILDKIRINLEVTWYVLDDKKQVVEYGEFEHRCVDEFWVKLDNKIVDSCKENVMTQEDGWKLFNSWLASLEINYPEKQYKISFLSDNQSYDIANIDYNLNKYCNRLAMRYSSSGKYRSIKAPDDMLAMASDSFIKQATNRINSVVLHDHNPVNDAYGIYLQYIEALYYRSKINNLLDAFAKCAL